MIAATIAPTSGATMKSQTWLSAVPPTTRAGPRLRAGFTDVPGERDADEVDHHQAEADGHAGRTLNGGLVGGEEHDHDEDGGEDDLDEERAPLAHEQVGLLAVAVGAQARPRSSSSSGEVVNIQYSR